MSDLQLKMDKPAVITAPEVDARPAHDAAREPEPEAHAPSSAQPADAASATPASPDPKKKNRCTVCKKKVGLLGFECKCGKLLCTSHRQAEEHQCDYDYRTEGKKRLADANPLVAFSKIDSI
jgi:AN1-type zinc finger protein 5/6